MAADNSDDQPLLGNVWTNQEFAVTFCLLDNTEFC